MNQSSLEILDRVVMDHFKAGGIRLPLLQGVTHGQILRDGWCIDWLLRTRKGIPFVDVYTTHRMTNSGHIRIHASGNVVRLPCEHPIFSTFHVEGDEEMERRQRWYQGFHERVQRFLGRKFAAQATSLTPDDQGGDDA